MASPTFTPLPTPPDRETSPETFSAEADAFLGALPQFQTDGNTIAAFCETEATTAETSASTAEAARDAAITARNAAQTAESNASTSASNAASSASSAAASAVAAAASASSIEIETGFWTPAAYQGFSTFTVSSGSNKYIKVGNLVTVWAYIQVQPTSIPSINTLSGLPYVVDSSGAGSANFRYLSTGGSGPEAIIYSGYASGYTDRATLNLIDPNLNTIQVEITYLTS
jgi:hypothetical protein